MKKTRFRLYGNIDVIPMFLCGLLLFAGCETTGSARKGEPSFFLPYSIPHGFRCGRTWHPGDVIGKWEGVDLSSLDYVSLTLGNRGEGSIVVESLVNPLGDFGEGYSNLVAALSEVRNERMSDQSTGIYSHNISWRLAGHLIEISERGSYGWAFVHIDDEITDANKARALMLKRPSPFGWAVLLREGAVDRNRRNRKDTK